MAQDLNRSIKVYIDNSDAMAKAQALEGRIVKLRGELEKLNTQGKRDSKESIATEKALKQLERTYGNYQNKIRETERILKNLSGSTYKELQSAKRNLRRELEKETRGTEAYSNKLKAYNAVQKEITIAQKEMNGTLGAQSTVMSRVANGFNKYFGIVTSGLAAITGLSFTFRKLSKDAAEMEDVYADVMKTTGMTREEVGWMNEEFKKVDTRTSREELNKIAEEGGRIGIAKDQILEFVVAMDKANVALGDSFSGGVEEIASKLGKLKMLFQETKEMNVDQAYLSIGSSINNLGAEGVASEQNIAEFTTRIGSLPDVLKPSIADTMALGAAFEESGIQAEIASRAYGIVLNRATTDTAGFAKVMKMSVQEVEDLINTNPLEFFLQFSQSLKGLNTIDTSRTLDELKISADGANKVIGAAANNTDRFRELLELSNESFREATSIVDEFNIKNNNAAAELEKRRKAFSDAAEDLGKRLNPALLTSTNYVTYLVKLLPGFLDLMEKYGKYILYLGTVYVAYVTGLKLSTFWNDKLRGALTLANMQLKIQSTLYTTGRVAGAAYNVVLGLLTGNITRARAAWALLNATLATTPFGLALAAVTALAGAFIVLRKNVSRARSEKDALSKINKDVAKSTANERAELERLLGVARNEKISKDERLKAIKQLNDISPEYLGNLTLENINTDAARKSVEDYTAALKENARQKAISGKMSELYAKLGKKEIDRAESERILEERRSAGLAQSDIDRSHQNRINRLNREIDNINQEIDAYQNLSESIYENKQVDEGLVKWRENANKMGKVQLEAWIKNNKDAATEYLKIAKDVYNARFIEAVNIDGGGGSPDPDKEFYKKKLAELEKYINEEKNRLAQARIEGTMSKLEYGRQLELLETERFSRMMEIYQLDAQKRTEVENSFFNHKIKMLEKIEQEELTLQRKLAELHNKDNELRKKADEARAENNLKQLKLLAKQNEQNYKAEFERENKRKAELVGIGMDFSNEMGELLGGALAGNEDLVASSLKNIVNMGLDLLKVQVQMAVAGATAQSLAQPDSVTTFGATGLARAAILVGLIEAAFAAVKSVVGSVIGKLGSSSSGIDSVAGSSYGSRVVSQRAKGKYDVIGADDGQLYSNVPYVGPARTGFISTPTLMGEQGRELVVSAPDLMRLQRHINYPLVIRALNDARSGVVPQRADGKYDTMPPASPAEDSTYFLDMGLLTEIRDLLRQIRDNPVRAYVLLSELHKKQELLSGSQKIGKK